MTTPEHRRIQLLFVIAACVFCLGRVPASSESQPEKNTKPYALIFGTAWGPDDRPLYGVKVKIRRHSEKRARWEGLSDHHGEFAQRVPAGKADYVVWSEAFRSEDGRKLQAEPVTVHVENDERVDTSLHLK